MVGLTVSRHGPVGRLLHRGARLRARCRRRGGGERLREARGRVRRPPAGRAPPARARSTSSSPSTWRRAGGRRRPTPAATTAGSSTSPSSCSDMDSAYARLRRFKVQHASTGPQLLPKTIPNAAGIRAFYFRDPDGHPLEVLQFPPDKGDPKWHAPSDRLFLGIDHTAIVVSDTRASLAFYRDVLGLPGGGREHELRDRAGAPEQRGGRPAPHHRSSRPGRARASSSSST